MRHALYRDYRPRSFKELVGQDHIAKTLQQALKAGRISHAYLFSGPRGVGKTSAARILAHEVNKLPYEGEATHLDIIELDAASNRGIDEIRNLREKVSIAPSMGAYKVYIIDEVHMLTRDAFNALLKTLEEPPAHSIFILATTEAHKLPETIISRTQRFEFKPIPATKAAKHLAAIAKNEKINITPGAIELLAEFGAGSFRDSISLLDQLSAGGATVSEESVRMMLGIPSRQLIEQLFGQIAAAEPAKIIDSIVQLKEQGIDAAAAAAALAKLIRQKLIDGSASAQLASLLKQLLDVPSSSQPYDYFEISLLEAANLFTTNSHEAAKSMPAAIRPTTKLSKPAVKTAVFDLSIWPKIVEASRLRAASIYTALKLAEPEFSDQALILKFEFPLHQKKINQAKNKALVAELIQAVAGQTLAINCIVDKSAFMKKPSVRLPQKPASVPISTINNIFGTAEVVEA